jgi:acyl carrier protein
MVIKDKVIEIIAEKALLKPIEIRLDSTINDLGLDSLGIVETVFALEEHFEIDIDINFNKIEDSKFDISTVRKIIISVEKLIISKTDELK